jgi:hypothetical protein
MTLAAIQLLIHMFQLVNELCIRKPVAERNSVAVSSCQPPDSVTHPQDIPRFLLDFMFTVLYLLISLGQRDFMVLLQSYPAPGTTRRLIFIVHHVTKRFITYLMRLVCCLIGLAAVLV